MMDTSTVVIAATGPSLDQADLEHCRGRARVLAVSDNYRIAPWADWLYSSDYKWWKHHASLVRAAGVTSELWTRDPEAAQQFDLRLIEHTNAQGLSLDSVHGACSGEHAIHLAMIRAKPRRILLLGYDMGATGQGHWFGAHPRTMVNGSDFATMLRSFPKLAIDLDAAGVEVVNCTPTTALRCFRQSEIRRCL